MKILNQNVLGVSLAIFLLQGLVSSSPLFAATDDASTSTLTTITTATPLDGLVPSSAIVNQSTTPVVTPVIAPVIAPTAATTATNGSSIQQQDSTNASTIIRSYHSYPGRSYSYGTYGGNNLNRNGYGNYNYGRGGSYRDGFESSCRGAMKVVLGSYKIAYASHCRKSDQTWSASVMTPVMCQAPEGMPAHSVQIYNRDGVLSCS
ncbi:MAG: hypothetical protein V4525_12665 [Pseudomonadota bacterium]